jgi:NADH-quinone oxidoreductase subunit L
VDPARVLAVLAALGGVLNLPRLFGIPSGISYELEHWLEPVIEFGEADITGTWAYDNKYILVAIACRRSAQRASLWRGSSTRSASGSSRGSRVCSPLDGTTTPRSRGSWASPAVRLRGGHRLRRQDRRRCGQRVGVAVKETATGVRKGQTGYVRQYAGIIGIGVVLLLGWFVVIRGIL